MPATIYSQQGFIENLSRVVKSAQLNRSVRACLLMTRDRDFALSQLLETSLSANCPLYHFTTSARRHYQADQGQWRQIGNRVDCTTRLLQETRSLKEGGLVIFEDSAQYLRDEGGNPEVRAEISSMLSPETISPGLVLVFLEPPEAERRLPSIIADQFIRLEIPYPRCPELEKITRDVVASTIQQSKKPMDINQIKNIAASLASGVVGLTHSAARDALRDALALNPLDFDGAKAILAARKHSQLQRELAMNVLDTDGVEEPIGLDNLIEHLRMHQDTMKLTGPNRSKGILLIGPPGTGKTMLARMVGKVVGLPVVEFRIASLMNSLLGETERRFNQAFQVLGALAPNCVFLDEIEKAFGDSSERDGGTMMRCTGSLLSWLSDNPYPNYIVATSNSLKRMGEIGLTMTRSERFDAAFFVDVPGRVSRFRMLQRWLEGKVADPATCAETLANVTEKFSGADLRSLVKQAEARANYLKTSLTMELLFKEVERKRVRAIALYDEFSELRKWGKMHCDPAGPADD